MRAAVDHYLEYGRSLSRTMRALGYPRGRQTLCDWIDELAPGSRKLRGPNPRTEPVPIEKKVRVVAELEARTGPAAEIAERHGVSRTAPYAWRREIMGHNGGDEKPREKGLPVSKAYDDLPDDVEALQDIRRAKTQLRQVQLELDVRQAALEIKKDLSGVVKAILTLAVAAALVAASFISSSKLAGHFSSPETYAHQIERLDAKKETVMGLSVGSATAAAVISMIPDDTCTPIADQLAGISRDFTVVLAAILLEKYLLTTLGYVFFGFVVPACLVVYAVGILMPHGLRARDFALFAVIRLLVVGGVV